VEFDELWDAADAEVLALHRASPVAYQEMQARVRRLHRSFCGLVRLPAEDDPDRGLPAVYVELPADAAGGRLDVDGLADALEECADRFLRGEGAGAEPVLAELHRGPQRAVLLRWSGGGSAESGDLEGDLREVLTRLLAGFEEPVEEQGQERLLPA
jgi:hypothetical protein